MMLYYCLCVDDGSWLSCPQAEILESSLISFLNDFSVRKTGRTSLCGRTSGLKFNLNRSLKRKVSSLLDKLINLVTSSFRSPSNLTTKISNLSELVLSCHLPFRMQLKSSVSVLVNHQEVINGYKSKKSSSVFT